MAFIVALRRPEGRSGDRRYLPHANSGSDQARHWRDVRTAESQPISIGAIVYELVCALGAEGIVSKRAGSRYISGRCDAWRKCKNPNAPAVRREAEEDWGRGR